MIEYLAENPLRSGMRVVDIGCGWGVLGTYCAKQFDSDMLMVDVDPNVFPLVNYHARLNNVVLDTRCAKISELDESMLSHQDIIIGSDICFWPELTTQLIALVNRAMKAGVQRILLADPGRPNFQQLAEYCQKNYLAQLLPRQVLGRKPYSGYLLVIENPDHAGFVGSEQFEIAANAV